MKPALDELFDDNYHDRLTEIAKVTAYFKRYALKNMHDQEQLFEIMND